MPQVSLGGITFASSGAMTTAGQKFVMSGSVGAPIYEKKFDTTAGTNGSSVRRFGFRERRAQFVVRYTAASEGSVISAILNDQSTLANAAFTAVIGNYSMPGCELDPDGTRCDMDAHKTETGTYWCDCVFAISQKRLA